MQSQPLIMQQARLLKIMKYLEPLSPTTHTNFIPNTQYGYLLMVVQLNITVTVSCRGATAEAEWKRTFW